MKTTNKYESEIIIDRIDGIYFGTAGMGSKIKIWSYSQNSPEEAENLIFQIVNSLFNELTEAQRLKLIGKHVLYELKLQKVEN